MDILKNTTDGIYPYQKDLWDKFANGGFKRGEMTLFSAGRQTGKSTMYMTMLKNRIYNANLCKEITLTAQECLLELTLGLDPAWRTGSNQRKKVKQYKFSRANWYVAEFDWRNSSEVNEWCTQQFGPHDKYPNAWSRWQRIYDEKVHFRDAKDYEWFVLKWS